MPLPVPTIPGSPAARLTAAIAAIDAALADPAGVGGGIRRVVLPDGSVTEYASAAEMSQARERLLRQLMDVQRTTGEIRPAIAPVGMRRPL